MEALKEKIESRFTHSADFIRKRLQREEQSIELMYLVSVADEKQIFETVVKAFYNATLHPHFRDYIVSMPNRVDPMSEQETLEKLSNGFGAVFSGKEAWLFDFRKLPLAKLRQAENETVIQGPLGAFSEDLGMNMNILRQRYGKPSLTSEPTSVGTEAKTELLIVYDREAADLKRVQEVKRRIQNVAFPVVQSVNQLAELICGPTRALFPLVMTTERPDRTAMNLSQGKVAVFMQGTPYAMIAPATFYDFFASMEDIYQQYFVSRFLTILRYVALFVSLTLPAAYVAVCAYNPELLREQLALSIAGSRIAVPYPAFVEVLFMLVAMELLVEASIRLPKTIGATATTVGGLILGQAATEAQLVSSIMIIIVATVAISNFVVPINSMNFAVRVAKYVILLFATFTGLIGIVLGLLIMLGYLVSMDSIGQPYLKLFRNDDRHVKLTKRPSGSHAGGEGRA